ncbi:MAG: ADP-ribosylglycohydrolase family protein [Candidatus Saganbacteria bacterium]|nr:ADP-ribosylglycohydrolase family protein [Candidatus Saganbacteria bacterium]
MKASSNSYRLSARFRGSVLGAASGDTLGASLEQAPSHPVRQTFKNRVEEFQETPRLGLAPGQWTDDTVFSRATLKCLVEYERIDIVALKKKLYEDYLVDSHRGFGKPTEKTFERGTPDSESAGCGAAMRIGPAALFASFYSDLEKFRGDITSIISITHTHPEAVNGALAVAFAIASAVRSELKPDRLIQQTVDFIGATSDMGHKLLEVEGILKRPGLSLEEGFLEIGTRGYILESVGATFYAFLRTPDNFFESVVNAANAGGDADSNASMTGAISGAFNSIQGIPKPWLANLEACGELDDLSRRLCRIVEKK